MTDKVNLLDFNLNQMRTWFESIGEKPYRAQQVLQWVHQHGVLDTANMTNLGKDLRARLTDLAEVKLPKLVSAQESSDGTRKWLLQLSCGNCIETVFIPEASRGTLCVSSQVGCGLNCSFCSTGKQGFNRHLSSGEIIGQLWFAVHTLPAQFKVTNVVLMGMGEPLLNYDNVVVALDLMLDDLAYGLSKYRVTLSTSGLIPEMFALRDRTPVALAVSLHAPNDALRDVLVPINKKYPLKQLMDVCRQYFESGSKRYVTFEYVMLKGVNDTLLHARELADLLKGVPSKVNLIPFNPFPMAGYERSTTADINAFREYLMARGINTITRKTRGDDIDAACGQLVGDFKDRTSRSRLASAAS